MNRQYRGRLYHIVSIRERDGGRTLLTHSPLTHEEACEMKGRFTSHAFRRVQLEEYDIDDIGHVVAEASVMTALLDARVKMLRALHQAGWPHNIISLAMQGRNG